MDSESANRREIGGSGAVGMGGIDGGSDWAELFSVGLANIGWIGGSNTLLVESLAV
jgi:hypothetical protein